jgi:hypothetical protein
MAKEAWVEARQAELLPVPYFHNVFTLPHELNPIILASERNQRALLKLLFDSAAQTLLDFGRQELGARIGFTLVLHTWDQQLRAHFHVHCLIASGGLVVDHSKWIAGGSRFLFPVRALSKVFRAKYLDGLAYLLEQGQLDVPPQLEELTDAESRCRLLVCWRQEPWVVYSKAPFAGPRKLLDYLGRYTHRVAISNHRILDCQNGQVRFWYRDRRDGDRQKIATISADEFIRRFLQHVVPSRFLRIRHYGFLANCVKGESLSQLGVRKRAPQHKPESVVEWLRAVLGIDSTRCPCCSSALKSEPLLRPGRLIQRERWDRLAAIKVPLPAT